MMVMVMVMVMVGGGGCVDLTGGRRVGVALKVGHILIGENLQYAEETYILAGIQCMVSLPQPSHSY